MARQRPTHIPTNDTIHDLKGAIKTKKTNDFSNVAADKLTLWRVSIPVVAVDKHMPVILTEIESTSKLDPTDDISDVSTDTPPKNSFTSSFSDPLQDCPTKGQHLFSEQRA
ncbi:hypothetical protein BGZ81_000206 [Podila clonocystis]|nr:hypothetical protein BGZ81_000206 [Podila clonocystis]